MEEIWKDIQGYENYYQISNLGKVRSLDRQVDGTNNNNNPIQNKKGKLLKHNITFSKYHVVSLSKYGLSKTFKVHRLVALTFIPNLENKPQVNHKDGDKNNNCIENLEWCTSKENMVHAYKNKLCKGMVGEKHPMCKLKIKEVKCIRKSKLSQLDLSKMFNVSTSLIGLIKNNKRWVL